MSLTQFNKKVSNLVKLLKLEILSINRIYLMSLLNQKLIHAIQGSQASSNMPDGFVQKYHYIYGLIASLRTNPKKTLKDRDKSIEKIFLLTEDIFKEYIKLWTTRSSINGDQAEERVQEYGAGLVSFLGSLYQPKLGSSEQFIKFTIDRFEAFDDRFFVPQLGLKTQECVDISIAIIERIRTQYEERITEYSIITKPMLELWQQFRDQKISLEESRRIVKENTSFQQMDNRIKNYDSNKILDSFIISLNDFTDQFSEVTLNAYFTQFSCAPGEINKSFRSPTDFNELDTKILMQIDANRYYVPEVTEIVRKLPLILEKRIRLSSISSNYFKHRDNCTQRNVVALLEKLFNRKNIFEAAYYGYKEPLEFETDILIPYDRTLIICEVKAKELRNTLHTEGNINKIKSDFKASIQEAYDQALRTRDYVLSQENVNFLTKKGDPLCSLSRDDFDNYCLLVVTAESFGTLASDLAFLLRKEESDPYPIAVSQFDLELLLSRINTPAKFFDYTRQRCQLHGCVFGTDELDFAGYYLKHGNLDFSDRLNDSTIVTLDGNYCRIFDEDWYQSHGVAVESTTDEITDPHFSIIERSKDEIKFGMEGFPDTFDYVYLHNTKTAKKHMPKMSGRNRNVACPCGSGKKYKKCCGKPSWLT